MKNRLIIYLIFSSICLNSFAQDDIKRINFILLIDSEIPMSSTISGGYILIKDSTNNVKERVPFDYKVGGLEVSSSGYKKIFSKTDKKTTSIMFNFLGFKAPHNTQLYESNVWLSPDFVIMNIYNKSKRENAEKYDFGEMKYLVQIETSSFTTILRYCPSWIRKHKSEIN